MVIQRQIWALNHSKAVYLNNTKHKHIYFLHNDNGSCKWGLDDQEFFASKNYSLINKDLTKSNNKIKVFNKV